MKCPECDGNGYFATEIGGCGMDGENDTRETIQEQCQRCNGTGSIPDICPTCDGSGEGMTDGTICLTCRGRGEIPTEQERNAAEDQAERGIDDGDGE